MPSSRRTAWLAAIVPLLLAQQAGALALLSDDRYEEGSYRNGPDPWTGLPDTVHEWHTEPPFFGAYPDRPDSAITLSGDGLGFDGHATGVSWSSFYFNGLYSEFSKRDAFFSIGFRIDGEGSIALDGTAIGDIFASEQPWVRVVSDTQTLYEFRFDPNGPGIDVDFAAALSPGEYRIEASAPYPGGSNSEEQFDFTFRVRDTAMPVPEPAAALLLGAGLAWLGATRRRP